MQIAKVPAQSVMANVSTSGNAMHKDTCMGQVM